MKRNLLLLFSLTLLVLVLLGWGCAGFLAGLEVEEEDLAEDILEKGRVLYAQYRDYDGAIDIFMEVLERYPDETESVAWAYYEIGMSYYRMHDFEEAEMYFDIVLENYPDQSAQVTLAEHLKVKIDNDLTDRNGTYQDEDLELNADIGFRLDTDTDQNEEERSSSTEME